MVATADADEAVAASARASLAAAAADADAARRPSHFPVQCAYEPFGAEIVAHSLQGWAALAPLDDIKGCDAYNMYNECDRDASFCAMREHDPPNVPCFRMLYAEDAEIYVDRTAEGTLVQLSASEVGERASRLGLPADIADSGDPDEWLLQHSRAHELPPIFGPIERATGATLTLIVTILLRSTRGWNQGCALATHGACLPQHIALARLSVHHPTTRVISYGDDTYGGDRGSRLYKWAAAKVKACAPLGHKTRLDKEFCYSPEGDLEHAPPDLPGSPRHPGGRLSGFKGVGAYVSGQPDWARRQLRNRALKQLLPLDHVDAMRDSGDVRNSAQIRINIMGYCANGLLTHSLRAQPPSVSTVPPARLPDSPPDQLELSMADAADARMAASFESLVHAQRSPLDRRQRAIHRARMPRKMGGMQLSHAAAMATPAYVASRLATWSRLQQWFPLFADVDMLTDQRPWLREVVTGYNDLRDRHHRLHGEYAELERDISHYCDGATTRHHFHPTRLPPSGAIPPLVSIVGPQSVSKPPKQRVLAAVVQHEAWRVAYQAAKDADAVAWATGASEYRYHETCQVLGAAMPFASAFLAMLPTSHAARLRTDELTWHLQRRFCLHVTATATATETLRTLDGDTRWDPLGNTLTGADETDKSAPHHGGLTQLAAAHRATSVQPVVLGDKENPDVYTMYDANTTIDLAEGGEGESGGDLMVEFKAWADSQKGNPGRDHETTYRGSTHPFGNTEERAIRMVVGVRARAGEERWCNATGTGAVADKEGDYDDGVRVKGNTLVLYLTNLLGGHAPGAVKHLMWLRARAKVVDRTHYESWAASTFLTYWTQRISAAIAMGDARRCLRQRPRLERMALRAANRAAAGRFLGRRAAAVVTRRGLRGAAGP